MSCWFGRYLYGYSSMVHLVIEPLFLFKLGPWQLEEFNYLDELCFFFDSAVSSTMCEKGGDDWVPLASS